MQGGGKNTQITKDSSASAAVAQKVTKKAKGAKDTEMDQELVLYEFVEVLIRIGFWRANPQHGLSAKAATKLVPLPDCLLSCCLLQCFRVSYLLA